MSGLSLILAIALAASLIALWRQKRLHSDWITKLIMAIGLKHTEAHRLIEEVTAARVAADQLPRERGLHEFFEAILNEIRQGVVIVDEDMRIRFANKPLAVILQRPAVQTGRTLIEEMRDHQLTDIVQLALKEQRRVVRQVQMLSADPSGAANLSGRYFMIEAAPLHSRNVGAAWLMVQDVTESALTEQIRKDFIANASHELRTPLSIINGYIETLQEGVLQSGPAFKRCLDTMDKHGKRIARLIEDMLAISRLEDSSAPLNCEAFEVRQCVQDAIDHLAPMVEGRDARFELHFPAQNGHITGDRFYWDQIFTNLIENALKENPQPGLVITVSGFWNDRQCILKVSDNGVGISAHDLPFIFKRFFRGDRHHSSAVKGTGLGLSIVKRAVEAHGGTISATSQPGIETTFTMTIPVKCEHGCD
ncbi:MAG: PAS domain-containing protein [Verrucomicrobiaceae bacterium]|jgi:two-component system phosphate regulon sensor histidine kinase PhoR|nr:PAS domain-containing protein [Verrucomicrobiaceae bacterium]